MIGFWLINILVALAISVTFTVLIFQLVGVDFLGKKPDKTLRRGNTENKSPVPLSGILLVPVTVLSTLLALGILSFWNALAVKTSLLESGINPLFLICALMIMYLTGLCNDLSRVRETITIIAEGLCAALIVISGLGITSLHGLFHIEDISSKSMLVLTVIVVVLTLNVVEIIGKDHKAGKGICTLALLFYGLALWGFGEYLFCVLAAAALGCNIIGDNLDKKNPLLRLGSTGGLTMGIIISMLAIGLCQSPSPTTTCWRSWLNPIILGLTPILILVAVAFYALCTRTKV